MKYLEELRLQREHLEARLKALPLSKRVAFAAACGSEVLPTYELWASQGDMDVMRETLERVWAVADGAAYSETELAELRSRCLGATPHTD